MKDRRKKIFLMSFVSFLVISGSVYIFMIFSAVNKIKSNPFFIRNSSFIERAFLPVLKYLNLVDDSTLNRLNKDKDIMAFDKNLLSSDNYDLESDENKSLNLSKFSSASEDNSSSLFIPSNKILPQLSNAISNLNSGSSTFSSFKKDGFKAKSLANNTEKSLNVYKEKTQKGVAIVSNKEKVVEGNKSYHNSSAQLTNVKGALISSLKSKSADGARMEWEKGFSGSIKPTNKMLYKDNLLEIDRLNAEVMNLKNDFYKSLPTGEVSAKIDKDNSIDSLKDDIKKEIMRNMIKDALSSTINPLYNKESLVNEEESLKLKDIPSQVIDAINEWQWESGQKAVIKKEGDIFIVSYKDDPENFQMLVDNRGKILKIKTICSNGWVNEQDYKTCNLSN